MKIKKHAAFVFHSFPGNKVPESLSSKYPIMPDIEITANRVAKHLSNLIIAGSRCFEGTYSY